MWATKPHAYWQILSSALVLPFALIRNWRAQVLFPFCTVLITFLITLLYVDVAAAAMKTEVSTRVVGIGQPVVVQLTYTQEDGQAAPENPQLKVGGSAQVQGPSVSTQSMVRMQNFSFSSEKSVVARFQVIPQKEGKLTIGPGSFQVGGRTELGETVVIEVVKDAPEPPQARRRRSLFGNDPFGADPFGADPFDDFFNQRVRQIQAPLAPAEYQVNQAPDQIAFLRAHLSRKKAVVGEPIVLTILAYGSRGDFGEIAPTEPALPDFLSYRAMDNIQSEPAYQTEISGQIFVVRKIREYIIVPLKTGELSIGALSTVLQNNRRTYPQRKHAHGYSVASRALTLRVSEPPAEGRPAGYLVGDVGRYQLQAELSSSQLMQGEFAELVVRIRGEGQIPSQLILPEQNGVVWEAPTMSGGPEVQDGVLKGVRTLKYTVQMNVPGRLELGEVTLPYFDSKSRKYAVARAQLGTVEVMAAAAPATSGAALPAAATDGSASDAGEGESVPQIAEIPMQPRATLLAQAAPLDGHYPKWAWWLMLAVPAAVYFAGSLAMFTQVKLQTRQLSPKLNSKHDLKEAEKALAEGKHHSALQLAERALFEAIEVKTGVKARGIMREELASELAKKGLDSQLAEQVQLSLQQLEASRYGSVEQEPLVIFSQVRSLVTRLALRSRGKKS